MYQIRIGQVHIYLDFGNMLLLTIHGIKNGPNRHNLQVTIELKWFQTKQMKILNQSSLTIKCGKEGKRCKVKSEMKIFQPKMTINETIKNAVIKSQ
uniref:Uncharacterized protein n=1 Tax=Tetranychus urticae TaxID=32264 RepID=T1KKB4_TETUR